MCTWGWNREFSLDQDESFWLENYKRVENSPLVFSHVELWIDFGGGSFMKIFEMGTRLLFGTSQIFFQLSVHMLRLAWLAFPVSRL